MRGRRGTERSRAGAEPREWREALRDSEERWRSLVDYAPAWIVVVDSEGTILYTNRASEGHSVDEAIGTTIYSFLASRHRMRARKALRAVFECGEHQTYQAEVVLLNGARAWFDNSVGPIWSDGHVSAAMHVSVNITQRKRAERRLDEHRLNLEKAVDERTSELANANQELRSRLREHRQVEQALRESERKYRELADLLPQFIFETDGRGVLAFLNRAGVQSSGYTREEIESGVEVFDLLIPDDRDRARQNTLEMLCGGVSVGTEYTALRKDGSTFPIIVYSSVITRGGNPVGLRGVAIDITERKEMEIALQRSEAHFRSLVERASDVVLIVDASMKVTYVSPAVTRAFGYETEELMGAEALTYVQPDDLPVAVEHIGLLINSGGVFERGEYRVRHKDGSWRVVEATANNLLDVPAVSGIVVNFHDVTERKLAEKTAHDTARELHDVLENSVDMIYRFNLETEAYDYASPSSKNVIGRAPDEIRALGLLGCRALIHPDDAQRVDENVVQLVAQAPGASAHSTVDYRFKHRTLGYRWVSDSRSLVFNEDNVPVAVVGALRDIHDRKTAEQALQRSEELFRSIVEGSAEVFAIVGRDGAVRYESSSIERLLGFRAQERMGRNFLELAHPEDLPKLAEVFKQFLQSPGIVMKAEARFRHKNGSWRYLEATGQNHIDHPAIAGIVINCRDVTERRTASEMLRRYYDEERKLREQLEREIEKRMGFTRALAHELKTPLTPLIASADLLTGQVQDERLLNLAGSIARGACNLNRRVDEILDLARGEVSMLELRVEPVDLSRLLRETAGSMVPLASKQGHSIALQVPKSLPTIEADAGRIHQVVANLLDNAIKFTPRGGRISLKARRTSDSVLVEVRDSGRGISKEDQERLFEPYQRLQAQGREHGGIGLGLSLSKMFVELHGGEIWVRSRPGKGSTFGFSLPQPTITGSAQ